MKWILIKFQVLWNIAWKCIHHYCLCVWIHFPSAALSVSALTASRALSRSTRYFWSCSKCQSQSEYQRKRQRLSVSQTHRVSKASLCAARGWIENHNCKIKKKKVSSFKVFQSEMFFLHETKKKDVTSTLKLENAFMDFFWLLGGSRTSWKHNTDIINV